MREGLPSQRRKPAKYSSGGSPMKQCKQKRRQLATPRASLCVLGQVVQEVGVFRDLAQVKIPQKMLRYTPQQKLTALLAGVVGGGRTGGGKKKKRGGEFLGGTGFWVSARPGHA